VVADVTTNTDDPNDGSERSVMRPLLVLVVSVAISGGDRIAKAQGGQLSTSYALHTAETIRGENSACRGSARLVQKRKSGHLAAENSAFVQGLVLDAASV
jgi:hypothetical protein